jgi:hypothetical protein
MAYQVVEGAQLMCTMGMAPGTLSVLPINMVKAGDKWEATVQDFVPLVNIGGFGMCISPANPMVAAATAAAFGVLTPMPCIPATSGPWSPGSSLKTIKGLAALLDSDKCSCNWAGTISITDAGQALVSVDDPSTTPATGDAGLAPSATPDAPMGAQVPGADARPSPVHPSKAKPAAESHSPESPHHPKPSPPSDPAPRTGRRK